MKKAYLVDYECFSTVRTVEISGDDLTPNSARIKAIDYIETCGIPYTNVFKAKERDESNCNS